MELSTVKTLLEEYSEPRGRLAVLFVWKRGARYESYQPSVANDVQSKIVNQFKENIDAKLNNQEIEKVPFNPSGQENFQYSECSAGYVGNYDEVVGLFNNTNTQEIEPDNVTYLTFRLRVNSDDEDEKYLYFFRKNHKLKSIRKGFWIRKVSNTFNVLDDNKLLAIDGGIDAISYRSEILFFSHISAERIFNLREKFKENADVVLNNVHDGEKIENFDQFRTDCLDDARIIRRLTKIQSNPEIIRLFHEHFENAPEVVELFDLNIKFNEDQTQVLYDDKEQLKDITMLMRDAYYRTVLADRKGVDEFN